MSLWSWSPLDKLPIIWIVEDDPSTQRLVVLHLRKAAMESVVFESAEKAYEALVKGKKPDLLLLDMLLPGMSGIDLARLLKQNPLWASIPVLVISVMSRADAVGIDGEDPVLYWINKPFDAQNLVQTVQKVLQSIMDKEV